MNEQDSEVEGKANDCSHRALSDFIEPGRMEIAWVDKPKTFALCFLSAAAAEVGPLASCGDCCGPYMYEESHNMQNNNP